MKIYQPIDGLLGRRRRNRRSRVTFGVFGVVGLSLALYWWLSTTSDNRAEARTDRIISLAAPDFTDVLSETDPAYRDAPEAARAAERREAPRWRPRPDFITGAIEPNQTVFVALRDAGASSGSIQAVVESFDGLLNFRRARPGDEWEARLDPAGDIIRFRYTVSPEEIYEAERHPEGGYHGVRVEVPTQRVVVALGGTVLSSIYDAVVELGEQTALASQFQSVFGWDIDFSRDAQAGDRFKLLVEKILLDGEFLRYGPILAAEYVGSTGHLRAYAFATEGDTHYYDADGRALRRSFLRAPLHYRRISSTFTRRRFHPVLQTYRPHLGVDYAASAGTPIWAVADGQVTFAGRRGGSGNLVVIEHDDGYESLYAHLSRFGDGIRRGRQVRQGEVIGYVGATGLATGPHLHFAVKHDGEFVDPLQVESVRAPSLDGEELASFRQRVGTLSAQLDAIAIAPVDLSQVVIAEQGAEDWPSDFGIAHDDEDDDQDGTGQDAELMDRP